MTTTHEPQSQSLLGMFKWIGKAVAWVIGFAVVVSIALTGYDQLDLNGYIHHDRTLDVYMSNDWLVGENRECSLSEDPDAKGKPTGKVLGLLCPMENKKLDPHNVSVTFKGILDPKDMNGNERPIPEQWKCTRGSETFTCEPMPTPAEPSTP
jgi:hypothetical protein